MTEAQFLAHMTEVTGHSSQPPQTNGFFPMKAELEITTAAGTTYRLPVDGTSLYLPTEDENILRERFNPSLDVCPDAECRTFSSNGLYAAAQIDNDTLMFIYGEEEGSASLFAPTSDALAVWNDAALRIYPLWSPRLQFIWEYVPPSASTYEIALQGDMETLHTFEGQAAWTPDGRLLAYSDADGLWLWDVYTLDSQPRLLLASSNHEIPVARYFSPTARYLAVAQGERQFTLDIVSGIQHPYGVVSPDERLLLSSSDAEVDVPQLCYLLEAACFDFPLSSMPSNAAQDPALIPIDQIESVEWMNTGRFVIFGCSNHDTNVCGLATSIISLGGIWSHVRTETAIAYDYDPENNALAILEDSSTIIIDGQRYELGDHVDSEIVSIRWGESLFYHE